jgi:CubicO group peptidase (beta-lactamase class C family)
MKKFRISLVLNLVSFLVLTGLLPTSGRLLAQSSFREEVERHVEPYLTNKAMVGLSVGILKSGHSEVLGFGSTKKDASRTPDGDTLYEIGSLSKVFTGVLLGDAVERGHVQLASSVADLVPAEFPQPHPSLRGIQLLHLATHTSGLPRMPGNLDLSNVMDPYGSYDARRLFEFLHGHELRHEPGKHMEYSNLAVGLLGELLSQGSGKKYEQLIQERIAGPLQMKDTVESLNQEQEARLAAGYTEAGLPASNWRFQALAGAGALRSSVNDLLRFGRACLKPENLKDPSSQQSREAQEGLRFLAKAIDLAWSVHRKSENSDEFTAGLNWLVAQDGSTRFHNGQTAGYHSAMFVNRELDQAVVVLSNTATMEVDRLAEDLFKVLSGTPVEPRQFEESLQIPNEVMQRYVGQYQLVPGVLFTVSVVDDKLLVGLTGQPAFQVFPKSETQWFYKVVEASITFDVDEVGKCNQMTLLQNGISQKAKRVN